MTTDAGVQRPPLLERIIALAIRYRWVVLALALLSVVIGVWSFQRLPIDATPDITNVQAQINTEAPGFSPLEAEQRITFPVETAIAGLPGLEYTRSVSRYGLSQVTVVFRDGTEIYFARQLVNERLQAARSQLPPGLTPEMGPIATGLGEIFMYTVEAKPGARRADLNGPRHDDVLVCMQVLEHVADPLALLQDIATHMGHQTLLYLEVPHEALVREHAPGANLAPLTRHWHEHVNFFTEASVRRLAARCGLHVRDALFLPFDHGARQGAVMGLLLSKEASA